MISVPSALLVTNLPELADGETLCELSRELYRQLRRVGAGPAGSFSNNSDGPDDIPACLQFFVDAFGFEALPRNLTDVRCAERIALAHVPTIASFVCFLRDRIGETELLLQRSSGGEEIISTSSRAGNYGNNPVYFTSSAAASGVRAQRASHSALESESKSIQITNPSRQKRVEQVASALSSSSSSSSYFPINKIDRQHQQQEYQEIEMEENREQTSLQQQQQQQQKQQPINTEENARRLRAVAEAALKEVRESSSSSSVSLQQLPLIKPVFLEHRRSSTASAQAQPLQVAHPKAWNASTAEDTAPKEKSAIYIRQMSVLQLSPARAKANAKASALNAGSVNASDKAPLFGGIGLRVGTIADPTYVPRIALPVDGRKQHQRQQNIQSISAQSPPPLPPASLRPVIIPAIMQSESTKKISRSENSLVDEQRNKQMERPTLPNNAVPYPQLPNRLVSPLAPAPVPKQTQTFDTYTDTVHDHFFIHEEEEDGGDIFSRCSSRQKTLLNWMRSAHGIEINPEIRTSSLYSVSPSLSHHSNNDNQNGISLPTSSSLRFPDGLSHLLKDGLLLVELVCACEEKSGVSRHSGRPTMKVLVKSLNNQSGSVKGIGASSILSPPITGQIISRTRTYLAGTVFPREGSLVLAPSACSKNIELALDVLRQRPRVNPRYLWSGEEIRKGASIELAWGVVEDIFKAYGGESWVSRNSLAPKSFNVAQRLDSAVLMAAAASNVATTVTSAEIDEDANIISKKLQGKFDAQIDSTASELVPAPVPDVIVSKGSQQQILSQIKSPGKYLFSSIGSSLTSNLGSSSFSSSSSLNDPVHIREQDKPQPVEPLASTANSAMPTSSAAVSAWLEAGGRSNTQSLNALYNGSRPAALVGRLPLLPEPLPVPSCVLSVLPLSSPLHRLHQQHQDKKIHASVTKNGEMPLWGGLFDRAESVVSLAGLDAGKILPLTDTMESEVRAWLRELELSGIAPLNEGGVHHVLDNPLYNGCLLVAVAKAVEPTFPPLGGDKPLRYFKKPISLGEARANVEAALHVFRCSRLTTLNPPFSPLFNEETGDIIEPHVTPLVYLFCCEELLVANHDAAWGLLWHIFCAQKHALSVAEQVSRIDTLRAKKVAARTNARANSVTARTVSRITKTELVPTDGITGVAGIPSTTGVPESSSSSSSLNVSFTGSLIGGGSSSAPSTPGRKFISNEKDVMLWLSSLGLLKQLGFNDDRMDDIPTTISSIVGPLCDGTLIATLVRMILIAAQEQADCDTAALGGSSSSEAITIKIETASRFRALQSLKQIDPTPHTEMICKANLTKALDALRSGIADRALNVRYIQDVGIVDALFEGRPKETVGFLMDLASFSKTRNLFTRYSEVIRAERKLREDAQNALANRLAALAEQERNEAMQREAERLAEIDHIRRLEEQQQREEESRLLAEKRAREAIERKRLADEQKLLDLEFVAKLQAQTDLADDEAQDAINVTGEHLYKWLTGLGILIHNRADLEIGVEFMPEFSDGVHFCNLVEVCENMRGNRQPLLGVERFPKTSAAMLSNFARVLERLRVNPSMPLGLLYSEARLRLGEGKATRRLLLQIRRAYGHHLTSSNFYEVHASSMTS
jgi:hypothetical protein